MSTSITRRNAVCLGLLAPLAMAGCASGQDADSGEKNADAADKNVPSQGLSELGEATSVPLSYATQFSLDVFANGCRLATLASGDRFLIVPEGASAPADLEEIAVIQQPLSNIYLVSTGMVCLVDAIDALDAVGVSSVKAEDSPTPAFAARLEDGSIAYGGIYRAPDYELISVAGCPLAIENTNIDHVPEVRAKLEELGVTVLMEQSSREENMLGRLEWIRLMGALFDRQDAAEKIFEDVAARVEEVAAQEPLGKRVAFFYVNEDGAAVTRRAGDYFSQLIEAAGGEYVSFAEEGAADSSPTTVTVEMEQFYAGARDADVIIYNGTIDDGVSMLADLVEKNQLLADFKAVREGSVWACDSNLYQQMTSMADIILDLRAAISGSDEPTTFFWKLA